MAEKTFRLEIVTPKKVVLSSDVTSFSAPGMIGGFQVLKDHAPLLSSLAVGVVKVVDESGRETRFATSGGFVEVRENRVVMLAETAERSDQIDIQRAENSRKRATKRLEEKKIEIDLERSRFSLQRAQNRLQVAQKK
ncbi:MAG TPA: F0F1 ATP synthase subunit epsilon [Bacteroidota bacterium]